jgi:hypothetical protein
MRVVRRVRGGAIEAGRSCLGTSYTRDAGETEEREAGLAIRPRDV